MARSRVLLEVMRIACCAVLAIACSSPSRKPQPAPTLVASPELARMFAAPGSDCPGAGFPDTTGWCPQPVREWPVGTWLAVSSDLMKIERLPKDPQESGRTSTLDRTHGVNVSNGDLTPRIQKKWLQLRTRPTSCHETAYGCMQGCSNDPGSTVFEDPDPVPGCIAAALDLPGGLVISVGGQLRTYARTELGISRRASLVPSALTAIKKLSDTVLLQDRTGVMWQASWKSDEDAPTLRALPRESEILAVSPDTSGIFLAITTDALVAFDHETLAIQWRLAGEVWSSTYDWELQRRFVLVIDRPRAIVYALDDGGHIMGSRVVYEGADLVGAHLVLGMKGLVVVITR